MKASAFSKQLVMKARIELMILALIFDLIVLAFAVSAEGAELERERPHVTRVRDIMTLEYGFGEPEIVTEDGVDVVTISGLETYSRAGEPVIPVKPAEVLVPRGMKIVDITSTAVDVIRLPGTYSLPLGKKPFRRTRGIPEEPSEPDGSILETNDFWPGQYHELVTVQSNRGYKIAYVHLFPLQYRPLTGEIHVATELRLEVSLAGRSKPHRAKPTRKLRKKLKRRIDNPNILPSYDSYSDSDDMPAGPPARSSGGTSPLSDPASLYYGANYKYIVITSSALADEGNIPDRSYSFQALCASKAARGIPAGIVTTDWIVANYDGAKPSGGTDNATRIRNFLIDAYQTWDTEYALLGGDKGIIPVREFEDSDESIPADLYYSCVDPAENTFDHDGDGKYGERRDGPGGDEVDLVAEIFTGRAAVENGREVVNFVRKTLTYESTDDEYLNVAATMGGYLGFGEVQEFTKPFGEMVRLGSDLYLGHFTHGFESASVPNARDFTVRTIYDEDWYNDHHEPDFDRRGSVDWDYSRDGWSATDDLLPILNGEDGNTTPQMIYISDHGDTYLGMVKLYTYSTREENYDHLGNLRNTNYFFLYDDSCFVGSHDYDDSFGEEITTMEHGAFGAILNSRYGWGSDGNHLDSPSTQFTREFFQSVLGEGILELGRAHQEAKESNLWRLYTSFWGVRYIYYELNLFGDPELRLRVTEEESCTEGDTRPTTCGTGACARTGIETCANGAWGGDSCMPGTPSSETCNGLDDDCDGAVDGLTEITTCGTGACTSTGALTCSDGVWVEGPCVPDLPRAETCSDLVDDDCDGFVDEPECVLELQNHVLPANGGVLESFTSEYGGGWDVSDLTNGIANEDGWSSAVNPGPQEFIYSFLGGQSAALSEAIIYGGTAEGEYYSKDVEVWISADGTHYTLAGSGTLAASGDATVTLGLGNSVAKKVKLVITSGYRSDYWELAEFAVKGEPVGCADLDGDGYSPEGGSCGPVDCDDSNDTVHPGAEEVCNDVDDDCDSDIDQGLTCSSEGVNAPGIGGYKVYYGMLHSHTEISDGAGTPSEAYQYARDQGKLDFFGVADHDYYPDDMTDSDWRQIKEAANSYNDDGNFVTFWGFEWTSDSDEWQTDGLAQGHITIVNSDDYCISTYEPARSLNQLVEWMSTRDVVAFFNHPGQYGTSFDKFVFDHSDKIVGMELWNRSTDYYSNDGYYRNDGGLGYYDEALRRGWYIGASGSQDNHDKSWGTMNEWRMAVLALEKTRASIYAGMKARRFYSSRDENLALSFTCNGAQMGSRIEGGSLSFQIEAFDGDNEVFSSLELLKNGTVIKQWTPNSTDPAVGHSATGATGDTFYVRVYQSNSWDAISSPIFIISGDDPDDMDNCPDDPDKTEPGECGCGVPEGTCGPTDTDGDGVEDSADICPYDPYKTEPGQCGCGAAEGTCDSECADLAGYTDAQGYACSDWVGYDCDRAAEDWGYSQAEEENMRDSCKQSCGLCGSDDLDSDGDGVPDEWEIENGLDPNRNDASEDPDGDGISNLDEYLGGTDPAVFDGNDQPGAPIPYSPVGNETVSLTPELQTEAFYDPDSGDTHRETQWQVLRLADDALVLDIKSAHVLTSLLVPKLVLEDGGRYGWRARFYDNHGLASPWSQMAAFTTEPQSEDADGNGIPDDQEVDAVLDLDDDGTADLEQDDIKCVNVEGADGQIGISIENGVSVVGIEALQSMDPRDPQFAGLGSGRPEHMPFGLIHFRLRVHEAGAEATVTVHLSEPAPAGSKWYKYDPIADAWLDYSAYAVLSSDRRSVTLTIVDGGIGDLDGSANGIIIDPSGLAAPQVSVGSGGSGGDPDHSLGDAVEEISSKAGCFIAAAAGPTQTVRPLNPWLRLYGRCLIIPLLLLMAVSICRSSMRR